MSDSQASPSPRFLLFGESKNKLDIIQWLNRFSQYAKSLKRDKDQDKIVFLADCLAGDAQLWFLNKFDLSDKNLQWAEVERKIIIRFTACPEPIELLKEFNNRSRQPNESLVQFADALEDIYHRYSTVCSTGAKPTATDRVRELKQRFLLGLNESLQVEVRRWINLHGGMEKFTLDDLLERARCEEGFRKPAQPTVHRNTEGEGKTTTPTFGDDNSVWFNQSQRFPNFRNNRNSRGRIPNQDRQTSQAPQGRGRRFQGACFHCGIQGHIARECRQRPFCRRCGGRGHTEAVCPTQPTSSLN